MAAGVTSGIRTVVTSVIGSVVTSDVVSGMTLVVIGLQDIPVSGHWKLSAAIQEGFG